MNSSQAADGFPANDRPKAKGRRFVAFTLIFVVALGVRLLCWNDARSEVSKVQTGVTSNYKHLAFLLLDNDAAAFFDRSSKSSNPDLLGHPPGYPIFLALGYGLFGESDTTIQIIQMFADSLAAVILCLIAVKLFPFKVAVIAGAMAALSPQFSWNSALLLPDTLAVLPLLLAIWLIIRGWKTGALLHLLAAGALIGVSCWLRANAFLLAPFLLFLVPLIFKRRSRLRPSLALIGGVILVIAPLTIRNAVVLGRFVPLSLGAGQTLIEGIADYDTQKGVMLCWPVAGMESGKARNCGLASSNRGGAK